MTLGFGLGFPRRPHALRPALSLNFLGVSYLDPRVTFSRATNATQFDSLGRLVWAPANLTPNSECVGAAVPTTTPTNWGGIAAPANGITMQVVGVGVDNGFNYIDIRWFGTSAGGTSYPGVQFNNNTSLNPARLTESYTFSLLVKKIAGGFIGNQSVIQVFEGSPGYLVGSTTNITDAVVNTSSFTRLSVTRTMVNASVTHVSANIQFTINPTDVVDLTLRIARPQLERTSVNSPQPYFPSLLAAQNYGPRFDYNPQTLAARGLLIEEARTNLNIQSLHNGNVGTSSTGGTAANGAVYKGILSTSFTADGTAAPHFLFSGTPIVTPTASTVYTVSAVVCSSSNDLVQLTVSANYCALDCYINFRFSTGTVVGNGAGATGITVENWGGGVYRISFAFTTNAAPTNGAAGVVGVITGIADTRLPNVLSSAVLEFFGLQLELGAFATSLIPTFGTSATRALDSVSVTGANFAGWWNQNQGTFVFSAETGGTQQFQNFVQVHNGTSTENLRYYRNSTVPTTASQFQAGGVPAGIVTATPSVAGIQKVAAIFDTVALSHRISSNGGAVFSGVPSAAFVGSNALSIGASATGAGQLNGWMRNLAFYQTKLSDPQLQALTA